jgi:threonine synthase
VNIHECYLYGANVHLVQGVISDAAAMMNHDKTVDWFDVSTLKEPYRVEGKKTLGYEIADQFAWRLPDVIMYPTGGGTGLIGMWKAFQELEALGWIDARRPRMVAVQSTGCAPIVKAFEAHLPQSEFWRDATTIASGIRVPKAFADLLILKVLYESRGTAVAVSDADIIRTIHSLSRSEGLLLCPEGAATIAALELLRVNEEIKGADVILVLNTASALKYVEVLEKVVERAQSAASMTGASA